MTNNNDRPVWIEIRDQSNRMLFKYNPSRNVIEIKQKNSDVYVQIKLDEIRLKHGYTPEDLIIVFTNEVTVVEQVSEASKEPYSNNGH